MPSARNQVTGFDLSEGEGFGREITHPIDSKVQVQLKRGRLKHDRRRKAS